MDSLDGWNPGWLTDAEPLFIDGEPDDVGEFDSEIADEQYISSFLEAGELLANLVRGQQATPDLLFLPVVFCYRHALELQLKRIISLSEILKGKKPSVIQTHNLGMLWEIVRPSAEGLQSVDDVELTSMDSIMAEWTAADPGSMSFRYSRDLKGQATRPESLRRIDVIHFNSVMLKVALLLESVAVALTMQIMAKD